MDELQELSAVVQQVDPVGELMPNSVVLEMNRLDSGVNAGKGKVALCMPLAVDFVSKRASMKSEE